jgi:hypothetical protein
MTHTAKFKVGDTVRLINATAGHDPEWLVKGARVEAVYSGYGPSDTTYALWGTIGHWPETRLTK